MARIALFIAALVHFEGVLDQDVMERCQQEIIRRRTIVFVLG